MTPGLMAHTVWCAHIVCQEPKLQMSGDTVKGEHCQAPQADLELIFGSCASRNFLPLPTVLFQHLIMQLHMSLWLTRFHMGLWPTWLLMGLWPIVKVAQTCSFLLSHATTWNTASLEGVDFNVKTTDTYFLVPSSLCGTRSCIRSPEHGSAWERGLSFKPQVYAHRRPRGHREPKGQDKGKGILHMPEFSNTQFQEPNTTQGPSSLCSQRRIQQGWGCPQCMS